jgi:hypothetical protein
MPRGEISKKETQSRAARPSAVMYWLHALTAFLYSYIAGSLIGRLRTMYAWLQAKYQAGVIYSTVRGRRKRHDRLFFRVRLAAASAIERSLVYRLGAALRRRLLHCSLNTYGIFSFFFGCFTVVSYLLAQYVNQPKPQSYLACGVIMIAVAFPLFVSDKPLSRMLGESRFFRTLLLRVCGIPAEKLDGIAAERERNENGEEHYFLALLLAVVLGLTCSLGDIAPYLIPAVAGILILVHLIFVYPEIGLLLIAFFAPLLTLVARNHPTVILLATLGVTVVAFFFKLVGGKRVLRVELLDGSILTLGVMYLAGGLISYGGTASLRAAMMYAALMLSYFLAANLLRTEAWIRRVIGAMAVSCVLVAALGIAQYALGDLGVQYVDLSLFSDLGGRVYATMENPNMLAEYLILLLPLLLAITTNQKRPLPGFGMLMVTALAAICLVLTWSRGAWLSALICTLLFLLLMGHRALSYMALSALPLTLLLQLLPEQIGRRLGSIGSMTDSSIRYRIHLWEGVGDMLRNHWLGGVGVGESAFCAVYAQYALPGIEGGMHSHSLGLQLLCELGVVGAVMFGVVVVLLLCNTLSYGLSHAERNGRRLVLGMLCGMLALLLMGLTDHVFYNYRVFLMFWLLAGVSVAQTRVGRAEMERGAPPHML